MKDKSGLGSLALLSSHINLSLNQLMMPLALSCTRLEMFVDDGFSTTLQLSLRGSVRTVLFNIVQF